MRITDNKEVRDFLDHTRTKIQDAVATLISDPNASIVDIETNLGCFLEIRKHAQHNNHITILVEVYDNTNATPRIVAHSFFDGDSLTISDWCIAKLLDFIMSQQEG